jgi:hypothetical protein
VTTEAASPIWTYGPRLVLGNLSSKSNNRQIGKIWRVGKDGAKKLSPFSRKSDSALLWTDDFLKQVPRPKQAYNAPVFLSVSIYYSSRRPDLDIALLQDAIQKAGIIVNDRWVEKLYVQKNISKSRPRVIFELKATPPMIVEP